MRRLLIISVGILLIATAIAAGTLLTINVPEQNSNTGVSGEITFTVDGKTQATCYIENIDMNIADDFEQECLPQYAGYELSNIEDWTGRQLKQDSETGEKYFE